MAEPFPFDFYTIPARDWFDDLTEWLVDNFNAVFEVIEWPIDKVLYGIEDFLMWLPPLAFLGILFIVAWRIAGWKVSVSSTAGFALIGFLGWSFWEYLMTTLAVIFTAVVFCAVVGIPLGIIAARSNRFESSMRPVLDAMQTIPPFVYLVPVVMLFGIKLVPATIATIIFSMPPIIRLTNLGIRQVDVELVEAAYAFGSTPWQVLREVQMPLAIRTIMAGLNQTLMLALSMVVIAALIGARTFGEPIVRGLNNLEIGLGASAGIAVVILAIALDRITQALGKPANADRKSLLDYTKGFGRFMIRSQKSKEGR